MLRDGRSYAMIAKYIHELIPLIARNVKVFHENVEDRKRALAFPRCNFYIFFFLSFSGNQHKKNCINVCSKIFIDTQIWGEGWSVYSSTLKQKKKFNRLVISDVRDS